MRSWKDGQTQESWDDRRDTFIRGDAVGKRRERASHFSFLSAELLDRLLTVGPADERPDQEHQDSHHALTLVAHDPGILDPGEIFM